MEEENPAISKYTRISKDDRFENCKELGDIPIRISNETKKWIYTYLCQFCGDQNSKEYTHYLKKTNGRSRAGCISCSRKNDTLFKQNGTSLPVKYTIDNPPVNVVNTPTQDPIPLQVNNIEPIIYNTSTTPHGYTVKLINEVKGNDQTPVFNKYDIIKNGDFRIQVQCNNCNKIMEKIIKKYRKSHACIHCKDIKHENFINQVKQNMINNKDELLTTGDFNASTLLEVKCNRPDINGNPCGIIYRVQYNKYSKNSHPQICPCSKIKRKHHPVHITKNIEETIDRCNDYVEPFGYTTYKVTTNTKTFTLKCLKCEKLVDILSNDMVDLKSCC
jgi:hypothetical protein